MEYLTRIVWLISLLCTCQCDRFKSIEDRLRYLERRISAEIEFRSHDTSAVFRRLDEMDLLINTTLEETFEKFKSDGVCGSSKTVDEEGLQQEFRNLRSDIELLRLAFLSQKINTRDIREKYSELESKFEQLKRKTEEEKQLMVTAHKNERVEIEKKFAALRQENGRQVEAYKNERDEIEKKFAALRLENGRQVEAHKNERDEIEKKFAALRQENGRQVEAHTNERDDIEKKFAALSRENERLVDAHKNERDEIEKKFAALRQAYGRQVEAHKNERDEIEKKFAALRQENVHLTEALKVLEIRLQKHERVHVQTELSSCKDAFDMGFTSSGLYYLRINDEYNRVLVYCDQETDNGGWTVLQRRKDGSEDFYRGWDDYRDGFGYIEGEFWLGNKYIHTLTGSRSRELRIDMEDFEGNKAFAKYRTFRIANENENYTLAIGAYQGNAGDSLKVHNSQGFTTKDRDNDQSEINNCAVIRTGAWWYNKCLDSNLNGHYYQGDNSPYAQGVVWYYWKNSLTYSIKFVEMKLR